MIDVLFYGHLNPRRRRVLGSLRRDHGLAIFHANANGPAFGPRLDALVRRAKVVLSLNLLDLQADLRAPSGQEGGGAAREWKMTRLLRPLASATAVLVSETMGSHRERSAWAGAIAFADSVPELAANITALLGDASLRAEMATRALEVFRAQKAEDALRGPFWALVERACTPGKS